MTLVTSQEIVILPSGEICKLSEGGKKASAELYSARLSQMSTINLKYQKKIFFNKGSHQSLHDLQFSYGFCCSQGLSS